MENPSRKNQEPENLLENAPSDKIESAGRPRIKYTDVVIDDDYVRKNLMPGGGLRMKGGHANWNGEVDLVRYSASESLSPEHRQLVEDRIEKMRASQEKTYEHEAHHIRNRENGLTPHVAAGNLRELLSFRILDELSAFATGEIYGQDMTSEGFLSAVRVAEQKILDSYYGQPFMDESRWYLSHHKNEPGVFSREISQDAYHKIMRHYFNINETDALSMLQKDNRLHEFTGIVNGLIMKLDPLLESMRQEYKR